MHHIRRATAHLATATLLALVCTGCQDANAPAPVNGPSTVPGVWSGDLWFTYDEHGLTFRAFSCGALRATIEAGPDGQLSGSWTLSGCGSPVGTLAGTITGQAVTLTLTTSGGSNLFQRVSGYDACADSPATAAGSATGTISTSDYDGTPKLSLGAAASLSRVADPLPGLASPVCYDIAGAWRWYASHP